MQTNRPEDEISEETAPQKREPRENLASQVIAFVRGHIASENLRPGARLPSEVKIAAMLGISRPIVREALRSLAATGLIEMAVGKRAQVSAIDGQALQAVIENAVLTGQVDVQHVMEMRRGFEISMAGLAAQRCSPDQGRRLDGIVADMRHTTHDLENYTSLDLQFHLTLAEASGNPLYPMMIKACRDIIRTSMTVGIERWDAMSEVDYVQRVHETIVAMVKSGDADAAREAMRVHFDHAIDVMFEKAPR